MKKLCVLLSMIIFTTFAILPAQASGEEVVFPLGKSSYQINGLQMPMDAHVLMENGRIYVPLRYLGEALGAQVKWLGNGEGPGQIILTKGNDGVVFRMDQKDYTVVRDGQAASLLEMDVTPLSIEGRLYLPARYVTSVFGYDLKFNEVDNAIHITQLDIPNTNTTNPEVDVQALSKDEKLIKGLLTSLLTLYALMP